MGTGASKRKGVRVEAEAEAKGREEIKPSPTGGDDAGGQRPKPATPQSAGSQSRFHRDGSVSPSFSHASALQEQLVLKFTLREAYLPPLPPYEEDSTLSDPEIFFRLLIDPPGQVDAGAFELPIAAEE